MIRQVPGAGRVAAQYCGAHDYTDPGKPRIAWDDEQARADLVDALVRDALALLGHLPEAELGPAAADAVGLLALVAGQDVEIAEDSDGRDGHWRIVKGTAPNRVISTVDPQARHIHKTNSAYRGGFKGHVALEPETGIITAVELTVGAGIELHESAVAADLLAGEDGPRTVLGDTAYGGGQARAELLAAGHTPIVKPAPLRPAVPGGFTLDDFGVDTVAGKATCPAGHTVPLTSPGGVHQQRKAHFGARCGGCPLRESCTKSRKGKILTIRPHHDAQAAARHQATTDPGWQHEYRRWRPMVERGIAWITRDCRRLHYRGALKNNAWLHTRAAAINLRTLINHGLDHTNGAWTLTTATG